MQPGTHLRASAAQTSEENQQGWPEGDRGRRVEHLHCPQLASSFICHSSPEQAEGLLRASHMAAPGCAPSDPEDRTVEAQSHTALLPCTAESQVRAVLCQEDSPSLTHNNAPQTSGCHFYLASGFPQLQFRR